MTTSRTLESLRRSKSRSTKLAVVCLIPLKSQSRLESRNSRRRTMKATLLSTLFTAVICLTACGGGSSTTIPVVHAATYSNASLSGTYSANFHWDTSQGGSALGTIQFDGSGNVTGGSVTLGRACTLSITGTYSLQDTALGSANLTFTVTSGTCPPASFTPPAQSTTITLAAGQQGQMLVMGSSTAPPTLGWAVKQ